MSRDKRMRKMSWLLSSYESDESTNTKGAYNRVLSPQVPGRMRSQSTTLTKAALNKRPFLTRPFGSFILHYQHRTFSKPAK